MSTPVGPVVAGTPVYVPPVRTPRRRPARRSQAFGDLVVNAAMLFLVNVWPGWQVVPFLTSGMEQVLPILNASMLVACVLATVRIVRPTATWKAFSDVVTTTFAVVVLVRMWQVFPFDVGTGWAYTIRTFLVVAVFGCAVGLVVSLVTLVGRLLGRGDPD